MWPFKLNGISSQKQPHQYGFCSEKRACVRMIPRGIQRTITTGKRQEKRRISADLKRDTCTNLELLVRFPTWMESLKRLYTHAHMMAFFFNHNYLNHGDTFQGKWSIAALSALHRYSPSVPLILSPTSLAHKTWGKMLLPRWQIG